MVSDNMFLSWGMVVVVVVDTSHFTVHYLDKETVVGRDFGGLFFCFYT